MTNEQFRAAKKKVYQTSKLKKIMRKFKSTPLGSICVYCMSRNKLVSSCDTDHIISSQWQLGDEVDAGMYDEANMCGVCKDCHKTMNELAIQPLLRERGVCLENKIKIVHELYPWYDVHGNVLACDTAWLLEYPKAYNEVCV